MKDSFIFYKSFYDAISLLGEKAQLKLYQSIMKLNYNQCKSMTEVMQLCNDIESTLQRSRSTFAQWLLIKPQLLANIQRYENGRKGGSRQGVSNNPNGRRGNGKNNYRETTEELPNNNVNENVNVNDYPPIIPHGDAVNVESQQQQMPNGNSFHNYAEMLKHEEIWKSEMSKRHHVDDWNKAIADFEGHAIANAQTETIHSLNEAKRYFNMSAKYFLKGGSSPDPRGFTDADLENPDFDYMSLPQAIRNDYFNAKYPKCS